MSIVVYFLDPEHPQPQAKFFTMGDFSLAIKTTEELRRAGMRHVSISTENENCVTQLGVASVENGKTPDGDDYTWRKRRP